MMSKEDAFRCLIISLEESSNLYRNNKALGKKASLESVIDFLRNIRTERRLRVPLYALSMDLDDRRTGGNVKGQKESSDGAIAAHAIELVKDADGCTLDEAAKKVARAMGLVGDEARKMLLTRRRNIRAGRANRVAIERYESSKCSADGLVDWTPERKAENALKYLADVTA